MSQGTAARPRRRFRRPRVSIRGLLLLVMGVAVGVGWPIGAMRRQAETVALIRQRRGIVAYDWQTVGGQNWRWSDGPACSHGLCARLGPDLLHWVTAVDCWDRVDDQLAERIGRLRRLEWLNVTDSPRFTDAGLAACAGLTRLKTLYMSQTGVRGAGLVALEEMTQLQTLEAWGIPCDDAACRHLAGLTNLETLGLTGARLTDAGLAQFVRLRRLRRLEVDSAGPLAVTSAGLAHLARTESLVYLILPNTRIKDLAPIRPLSRLELLNVSGAPLTDVAILGLADLPRLTDLDLSRTQITDASLATLARCPKLARITLDKTAVTAAGIVRFHQLRSGVVVRRNEATR